MRNIQENITSILKERTVHRHLGVVVCMIAVITALAVIWSLHLNGITLTSEDPACGMQEHTHTEDCYAWVAETDGTEELEITESTEAIEIIDGTERIIGTESTGTASTETVSESTESTESIIDAAAGTESVTEIATESATEALTEEETESPQPGDVKVVDGVTYVYTLVCGMEEHTHTEACYESETSEEDSTAEEISETESGEEESSTVTAGVSEMFYDTRVYLGSAASGSEPVVTSLTSSLGDDYFFADTVSYETVLSEVASGLGYSYLVYTQIGDDYYLVNAEDGSLTACDTNTSLSTNPNYFSVAGGTDYLGWNTTESTFYNYLWTLTESSDEYSFYNSATGNYLAPGLEGSATSVKNASSSSSVEAVYSSLTGDGIVEYSVTVDGFRGGDYLIYDFLITESYDNSTAGTITVKSYSYKDYTDIDPSITVSGSYVYSYDKVSDIFLPYPGGTLTMTATRVGTDLYLCYKSTYQNVTGTWICVVSGLQKDSTLTFCFSDYKGDFTVSSAAYYNSEKNVDLTYQINEDAGNSGSYTVTSFTDIAYATFDGDFDVTYSFQNVSKGTDNWDNFYVQIQDKNSTDTNNYTVRADYFAWYGTDTTNSISPVDISVDWTDWLSSMQYGVDCTVRIIRTGDVFTFIVSAGTVQFIIQTDQIENYSDTVTVHIGGEICTLSNITLTQNSKGMQFGNYTRVTSSTSDDIYLTTSSSESNGGWSAISTGYYNESLNLIGQLLDNSTEYVEWVTSTTAGASVTGTTTSLTNTAEDITPTFYLARVRSYTVHFDGTNGGASYYSRYNYYYDSTDLKWEAHSYTVTSYTMDSTSTNFYVDASEVPVTQEGYSQRMDYQVNGWYDIYNKTYYPYDSSDTTYEFAYSSSSNSTVCYADWVAMDYDGGDENDTYYNDEGLDTSSFITTYVYDYNDLFNFTSVYLDDSSTVSSTSHSEVWEFTNYISGVKTILRTEGTGFIFYTATGLFNPNGRESLTLLNGEISSSSAAKTVNGDNSSSDAVFAGLLTTDSSQSGLNSSYLLNYLYDRTGDYGVYNSAAETGIIGKNYLGTGNYLYQYDDNSGYYYYDSAKNAAFYNQSENRFYLYDFLVRISKSTDVATETSSSNDFLPFNYADVSSKTDNSTEAIFIAGVDYFFGTSTEIKFYLPDATGYYDTTAQTYGNQSSEGLDMVFKFMGDDDVWVFVDDELVLDLGGIHDAVYGEINFSKGTVTVISNTNKIDSSSNETYVDVSIDSSSIPISISSAVETTDNGDGTYTLTYDGETVGTTISLSSIEAGSHTLTFYYLERGASEANSATYFNLSSQCSIELTKIAQNATSLEGTTFDVYNTSDINNVGDSAYKVLERTIAAGDTGISVEGLVTGNTYYLVETVAPEGYPLSHNIIKVYISARGRVEITVYASDKSTILDSWTGTVDALTHSSGEGRYLTTATLTSDDSSGYVIYTIAFSYANNLEYELASTGSTGITRYLITGEILIAIAGIGLILIAFYQFAWIRRLRAIAYKKEYTKEEKTRQKCFARMRGHPRERSVTRGHARDRPEGHGTSSAHGAMERSRGTGPGG